MKTLDRLSGRARRRHMRTLRKMRARWARPLGVWVSRPHEFRVVERLHRAGLVVAVVSKYGWLRGRGYRELQIFARRAEAELHGGPILIGGRR